MPKSERRQQTKINRMRYESRQAKKKRKHARIKGETKSDNKIACLCAAVD